MNNTLKHKLGIYYKEISDGILCSGRQKNLFINDLKKEVDAFVDSTPDADMAEILSVFGSSEEIAAGFNSGLSQTEIKKRLSVRRVITVLLIAALAVWALFAVISLIDVHSEAHGYFTEELLYIYNMCGGEGV